MSTTIIAKNVRLSFDKHLFVPSEGKNGKSGKRNCNCIFSPDTKLFELKDGKTVPISREQLNQLVEKSLKDKFGGKVPPKWENWALRPNTMSNSTQTGDRWDGYEDDNEVYISPSRFEDQGMPAFLRRDASQLRVAMNPDDLAEAKRLFYGGCYVNVKFTLGAFEAKEDNMVKRGVTTYLEGLQFVRDGERFGKGEADGTGMEAEPEEDDVDV